MKFQRTTTPPPGNGNNPTPEDEKRPWPKHGAFSALTLYRERQLDLRKKDHRAIHEWQLSLIEDLGGQTIVDTFQRSMIDRATELLIIISVMADHVEKTAIIDKSGELAPCLRSSFITYVNSFRHVLESAFEHGKKKPKKVAKLEDYLKGQYEQKGETDEG